MNVKLVISLLCVIGLIIALSYFPLPNFGLKKLPPVFGLLLTILFIPTILRSSINPILYSFQEQIALSFATNENIRKLTAPVVDNSRAEQFQFLDKAFKTIPVVDIHYARIVVLVMEGISFNEFARKSQTDANSFFNRHKKNIVSFTQYHTLNLDSYTSLISMLNSIFIPYRAYVNEQKYSFVNNRNSLTRFFNKNGFSTHFLTSYGEQQERFVPNITEWTQAKFMENIGDNTKDACITTSKIENACEDLAVFDDLMRMLKNNRRAFVFQEMVYGHTAAWSGLTGVETVDYYNRYFNKVVDALKKSNILDSTLLVITSDHGPRDDAYNRDNYHIPLMVFASDLQESSNNDFVSHLDFKDLLLALIANRKFEPGQKPIYTLGNSGEFVYGMINAEGSHVFINNRMRHVRGDASKAEIHSLNKNFDLYQNEEYVAIAQKLIYFMTGVTPKIALDNPGQALPCTFLDPKTNAPMDFGKYQTAITRWYADGTYIKRLREDLAAYNHRSLFKGIFRMMGKTDFSALSDSEAQTFIDYLLAALSVIGTEKEQAAARKHLSQKWGTVEDHYGYFKKYYFEQYTFRKER